MNTSFARVIDAYRDRRKKTPKRDRPRKLCDKVLPCLQAHLGITSPDPVRHAKVIILREYNNEDTLILGCGNDPCYAGGTPTHLEDQNLNSVHAHSHEYARLAYWREYRTNHLHTGCYTVNPSIGYNPSIIGHFGIDDFRHLPAGCFKEIVFEGFRLEPEDNVCTIRDVLHLLCEGGSVHFPEDDRITSKFDGKLYNGKCIITDDSEYSLFM